MYEKGTICQYKAFERSTFSVENGIIYKKVRGWTSWRSLLVWAWTSWYACEYPVILMTPCERELRVACCKELFLSSNHVMLLYWSVISLTQFDGLGITILLSEIAKAKVDQNYKFHFVKCWKTYSTIWKYCLKDFIWTPKDFIHKLKS